MLRKLVGAVCFAALAVAAGGILVEPAAAHPVADCPSGQHKAQHHAADGADNCRLLREVELADWCRKNNNGAELARAPDYQNPVIYACDTENDKQGACEGAGFIWLAFVGFQEPPDNGCFAPFVGQRSACKRTAGDGAHDNFQYDFQQTPHFCECSGDHVGNKCRTADTRALHNLVVGSNPADQAVRAALARPNVNLDHINIALVAQAGNAAALSILVTAGADPNARHPSIGNRTAVHLIARNAVDSADKAQANLDLLVHFIAALSVAGKTFNNDDWNPRALHPDTGDTPIDLQWWFGGMNGDTNTPDLKTGPLLQLRRLLYDRGADCITRESETEHTDWCAEPAPCEAGELLLDNGACASPCEEPTPYFVNGQCQKCRAERAPVTSGGKEFCLPDALVPAATKCDQQGWTANPPPFYPDDINALADLPPIAKNFYHEMTTYHGIVNDPDAVFAAKTLRDDLVKLFQGEDPRVFLQRQNCQVEICVASAYFRASYYANAVVLEGRTDRTAVQTEATNFRGEYRPFWVSLYAQAADGPPALECVLPVQNHSAFNPDDVAALADLPPLALDFYAEASSYANANYQAGAQNILFVESMEGLLLSLFANGDAQAAFDSCDPSACATSVAFKFLFQRTYNLIALGQSVTEAENVNSVNTTNAEIVALMAGLYSQALAAVAAGGNIVDYDQCYLEGSAVPQCSAVFGANLNFPPAGGNSGRAPYVYNCPGGQLPAGANSGGANAEFLCQCPAGKTLRNGQCGCINPDDYLSRDGSQCLSECLNADLNYILGDRCLTAQEKCRAQGWGPSNLRPGNHICEIGSIPFGAAPEEAGAHCVYPEFVDLEISGARVYENEPRCADIFGPNLDFPRNPDPEERTFTDPDYIYNCDPDGITGREPGTSNTTGALNCGCPAGHATRGRAGRLYCVPIGGQVGCEAQGWRTSATITISGGGGFACETPGHGAGYCYLSGEHSPQCAELYGADFAFPDSCPGANRFAPSPRTGAFRVTLTGCVRQSACIAAGYVTEGELCMTGGQKCNERNWGTFGNDCVIPSLAAGADEDDRANECYFAAADAANAGGVVCATVFGPNLEFPPLPTIYFGRPGEDVPPYVYNCDPDGTKGLLPAREADGSTSCRCLDAALYLQQGGLSCAAECPEGEVTLGQRCLTPGEKCAERGWAPGPPGTTPACGLRDSKLRMEGGAPLSYCLLPGAAAVGDHEPFCTAVFGPNLEFPEHDGTAKTFVYNCDPDGTTGMLPAKENTVGLTECCAAGENYIVHKDDLERPTLCVREEGEELGSALLTDELLCEGFGGVVQEGSGNARICSGMDGADTFCIMDAPAPYAFACRGLFKHVRDCNLKYAQPEGRPALNPFLCAPACPAGQKAVGGICVPAPAGN